MRTFNIHEAKTHLSRLVEKAAGGETIIIAKAGKPLVKVVALETAPSAGKRRIGLGQGASRVPNDIKSGFQTKIEEMFYKSS